MEYCIESRAVVLQWLRILYLFTFEYSLELKLTRLNSTLRPLQTPFFSSTLTLQNFLVRDYSPPNRPSNRQRIGWAPTYSPPNSWANLFACDSMGVQHLYGVLSQQNHKLIAFYSQSLRLQSAVQLQPIRKPFIVRRQTIRQPFASPLPYGDKLFASLSQAFHLTATNYSQAFHLTTANYSPPCLKSLPHYSVSMAPATRSRPARHPPSPSPRLASNSPWARSLIPSPSFAMTRFLAPE